MKRSEIFQWIFGCLLLKLLRYSLTLLLSVVLLLNLAGAASPTKRLKIGQLKDKAYQAVTLASLGRVYSDLGDNQKALTDYNQALSLHHTVGNKSGEATTLNNIGRVYSHLHKKHPSSGYDAIALQLSDRSRARGLVELLTEAHTDIRKGIDKRFDVCRFSKSGCISVES